MTAQLAIVGLTFRDASTPLRARAVAVDRAEDGPSHRLVSGGFARGVVRIETCSRSEWVISADDPKWAAELLRSALVSGLGPVPRDVFHVRTGLAALHYLFRISTGLDSLAEGEAAVARQVLKAFEDAHRRGLTDRTLHLAWNSLGKLANHKRRVVPARPGVGVQKLALDEIAERGVGPDERIAIVGMGQIGSSVEQILRGHGFRAIATFGRATLPAFVAAAAQARVVVAASGAPAAWLTLPARSDQPLCVDLGSPSQVDEAPGWQRSTLDVLLARPGCFLADDEHERLLALVEAQAASFLSCLDPHAPGSLGAMSGQKAAFVHGLLPKLLESVNDPAVARGLRREINAFTHDLIEAARGSTAAPLAGGVSGETHGDTRGGVEPGRDA